MVPDMVGPVLPPGNGIVSAQLCRLAVLAMTQYALSVRTWGYSYPKGYWVMA